MQIKVPLMGLPSSSSGTRCGLLCLRRDDRLAAILREVAIQRKSPNQSIMRNVRSSYANMRTFASKGERVVKWYMSGGERVGMEEKRGKRAT